MDKQSAIRLLDETFNSDFEINRFIRFVKELFNDFAVNQKECTKFIASQYKEYIASFDKIGDYENARKSMEVLVVQLNKTSSRDRARTMQRNFIANWLGKTEKDAALVAFYGDDPQDWRFSFVKMEYQLTKDEDGKVTIVKELTPAKRYSFLVGVNEPNHTCRRQFLELVQQEEINPTLEELETAFSIDNVTKEFFLEYKGLYLGLKESLEEVIEQDPYVKKEFEEKDISTVDFAKKLLGQIVFIYFLQKKGWLGVGKDETGRFKSWGTGPKNFLRKLFDKEIVPYDNFFNDILEPLFYEALATERDDDYYSRFNCKIPFLNGGLFEPINDYDWAGTEIVLDNSVFEKILTTFDRFNFTVKEDEPLEKEVAIDPEMLGKVFENLLEIKDRKSTGRYYTPREIVHYMCQQSLINYLETNTPISIPRDDIEKFIQLGDFALDLTIRAQEQKRQYHGKTFDIDESLATPKPIEDNYKEIDKRLKEIKIVDPAVGSGAFPIGMMNEIVKARSLLTLFFQEDEQRKRAVYNFKRETIENCLYGVDIDSSAVDIAKLRFWLSLIVDEEDIKIIKPLPNLDNKIMCGNSLLEEFEGKKLFDEELLGEVKKDYSFEVKQIEKEIAELNKEKGGIALGKLNGNSIKEIDKEIKKLERKKQKILLGPKESIKNLTLDEAMTKRIKESQKKLNEHKKLQNQLFNEQNRNRKKQLREDIDKIEWELIEETLKEQGNEEAMQKLEQYKKNKSKPFFLWKLYFSEVFQRDNPGFDVVIANPPYIQIKQINQEYKKIYEHVYEFTNGRFNIFYLFIELAGKKLTRKYGISSFIVPDRLLLNTQCSNLREWLLKQQIIIEMDSFKEEVFESAVVDNILIFFKNNIGSYDYINIKNKVEPKELNLKSSELVPITSFIDSPNMQFDLNYDPKRFSLTKKIRNQSVILGDISDIRDGIIQSKIPDILFLKKVVDEDTKKLLFGKDVTKYKIRFNNNWVNYKPDMMMKIELQRNGGGLRLRKKEIFERNKILTRQTADKIIGTFDDSNYYYSNTLHGTTIRDKKFSPFFVLAILNSSLINWYYKTTTAEGGKVFAQVKIEILKLIPIKKATEIQQKPFINLVDQILSITKDNDYLDNLDKQSKVKRLEEEIDKLVYELYELTPEEIEIVEALNKEK